MLDATATEANPNLMRTLFDKAEDEALRCYQEHPSSSLDALVTEVMRTLPAWRLDRMSHNDQGRWFACLIHKSRREWLEPVRVAAECPTLVLALMRVMEKARELDQAAALRVTA